MTREAELPLSSTSWIGPRLRIKPSPAGIIFFVLLFFCFFFVFAFDLFLFLGESWRVVGNKR
jgi:hypothetical protein